MTLEDKYNELQQKYIELMEKDKALEQWELYYRTESESMKITLAEERRQFEGKLNLWKGKYYKILQENIELLEKLKSFMDKES